uniref:Uncharacterized protein n=1 Tax=viral metagenome TaxID=1070528 RepID=A0A6M3M7F1_9ZZZZ
MEISIKYAKEIIHEAIGRAALSAYLCADSDERLAIYHNGCWIVGKDVGHEIDPDEQPFSLVECPGWHDVDCSFFTNGEVYDPRTDMYVNEADNNGNRAHYSEKELIGLTCDYGDVENELTNLRNLLLDFVKDRRLEHGF